jgi:transcription elongation factor Elf1
MESINETHSVLKCPHCGKYESYNYDKNIGFIECVWCNTMMDIDEAKQLARKDWA